MKRNLVIKGLLSTCLLFLCCAATALAQQPKAAGKPGSPQTQLTTKSAAGAKATPGAVSHSSSVNGSARAAAVAPAPSGEAATRPLTAERENLGAPAYNKAAQTSNYPRNKANAKLPTATNEELNR